MVSEIKLIRFFTGEEILAEVSDWDEDEITVKNPLRIVVMPQMSQNAPPKVGLAPFLEFAEEKTFTFQMRHVMVVTTPVKEFVTQYKQVFSNLVVPKSKLII